MAGGYSLMQSTFMMGMASYGANDVSDSPATLTSRLKVYLNGGTDNRGITYSGFFPDTNALLIGGDWEVVWGPAIYSFSLGRVADNAMYVAHSPSQATYVVAIAGTNPASFYDWLAEDADVFPINMVPWPPKLPYVVGTHSGPSDPATPWISAATAIALSDSLTQLADPTTGMGLEDFLDAKRDSTQTLIFTGHSLAGALAPTMAFYLYPSPKASGWKQVLVLPAAGPSPGTPGFANSFAAAYTGVVPSDGLLHGLWNRNHVNARDVVPHAWNRIAGLVGSLQIDPGNWANSGFTTVFGWVDIEFGVQLDVAATAAMQFSQGDRYYLNLPLVEFTPDWGEWQEQPAGSYPPVFVPLQRFDRPHPMTGLEQFHTFFEPTHVDQYYRFFNTIPSRPMAKPATV